LFFLLISESRDNQTIYYTHFIYDMMGGIVVVGVEENCNFEKYETLLKHNKKLLIFVEKEVFQIRIEKKTNV
jgi:hypothetical protein